MKEIITEPIRINLNMLLEEYLIITLEARCRNLYRGGAPLALLSSGGAMRPGQLCRLYGQRQWGPPWAQPCGCLGPALSLAIVPQGPTLLLDWRGVCVWEGGRGAGEREELSLSPQSRNGSAHIMWERIIFILWNLMGYPPHPIFNNVANEPERRTNIIHGTQLFT